MASACLQRMGFTAAAAAELTSAAGQDLSTLEEFAELDSEGQKLLWRLLARPVGLNAQGDRDPGIKTSGKAQANFGLMCYYINHVMKRTDRTLTWAGVTLPQVKTMRPQIQQEDTAKDPAVVPTIDAKNWPRTMESVENYIRGHLGVDKTPLKYVIRVDLFPPPAANDPIFGAADSEYLSIDEEIIARHRIVDRSIAAAGMTAEDHEKSGPFAGTFRTDNTRVYDLLVGIFAETDSHVVLKPFKKQRNGRGAWRALFQHYLGPNNVDHLAAAAEKELDSHRYNGESRNYSLEQHILCHKKAHGVLDDLKDFGYSGIDERSKVRKFCDSIKTKALDTIKGQIMASAELRTDFDRCTTLFKDFLAQDKLNGVERQISAVNVDNGKDLSYVPKDQWHSMSPAEQNQVKADRAAEKARRQAQGEGGKGSGGAKNGKAKSKNKQMKFKDKRGFNRAVKKEVTRQIKALSQKPAAGEDSDDDEVPMKDAHNMRQPAARKKQVSA